MAFGIALFFIATMRLVVHAIFSYLSILLPVLIALVSYCAVFVALSADCVFLYFLCSRWAIYLICSFVFLNLSSASVLIGILVMRIYAFRLSAWNWHLGAFLISLILSFVVSLQDKIVGFMSAIISYQPTVPIFGGLTRNAIFTSFYEDDYIRGGVYLVFLFVAPLIILLSLCIREFRRYGLLFYAGLPAFFLEGLGVVALIVPLFMLICQVPLAVRAECYPPTRA